MRSPLPSLEGAATWLGAMPDAQALEGHPLLIHFWSVSCHICHNVVDQVNGWRDKYGKQGLITISIHQPRSESELDIEKVSADARGEMKMTQPCAIDNDHAIVENFQNQFVPAYYVFNRKHELRHFQAGDKGYDRIEAALERVVNDPIEDATVVPAGGAAHA